MGVLSKLPTTAYMKKFNIKKRMRHNPPVLLASEKRQLEARERENTEGNGLNYTLIAIAIN